ncbi:MAG: hypothetical protein HYW78_01350 [Parcubacteria group bacterium]|nr:hypothetical protein [Parcubacteria group bacterium]
MKDKLLTFIEVAPPLSAIVTVIMIFAFLGSPFYPLVVGVLAVITATLYGLRAIFSEKNKTLNTFLMFLWIVSSIFAFTTRFPQ